MKSRIVAIGSWLLITALIGCGDDSSPSPDNDAGPDGGETVAGSGGKGGSGGQSAGGKGGQNAGGVGGQGSGGNGEGGEGGSGSEDETYTIGGSVTGLKGKGLVLVLNDANDVSVGADGEFTFDKELGKDKDYRVAVKTQPSDPVQACAVTDGEGKVGEEDVDNVKITCSDVQRSIGGKVSGLGSGQIVLKNNNGDDLTVTQDGTFTFKTLLKPGAGYEVTVGTAPNGRTCSLTKGKGTLGGDNITDVTIACYEGLTLSARPRPGSVGLTWNNNGGTGTTYTAWAFANADCNLDNPDACTSAVKKENVSSPYAFSELENGKVFYFHVRGNHPDNFTTRSNVAGARPNEAAFDKDVNAFARGGDGTIYVGGAFGSVGAYTGPVIPLDKKTGLPSRLPGFQVFTGGSISAIVPDGSGGYFVAGRFDLEVSDTNTIHNLAHVTNTGAVDPMWKPEPGPDGSTVRAIALAGDRLYLAGNFTTVGTGGGNGRAGGLAAVSTTGAGALVAGWNPVVTPAAGVDTLVATATTVYVGGRFTVIGANSAPRAGLAALEAATANAAAFDPNPRTGTDPAEVQALALSEDTLYVSGTFDTIGGSAHSRLAAVGLTGTGTATAFTASPTAANPPTSLALSGNVLYIGGNFTDVGGTARNRLAALDKATGALQSWDPGADDDVQELAASGDTIYVSGDFQNIAGKPRKYVAAIDKDGKLIESWDPRPSAGTKTIAADNDTVYVAGDTVVTYGAEPYARLAAFKGNSLTTWSAAVGGGDVLALAVAGDNVYVGGTFKQIGTADRNGVASITNAGALRDWNAALNTNASVQALAANSDNVYLGGVFATSTGNRANLVALKTSDATIPANWAFTGTTGGGGTSGVSALALDSNTLYLGGDFGNASGSSRSRLAAVDAGTGMVTGWNPNASGGQVRALTVVGDFVYAGGTFTTLGGDPHPAFGAISKAGAGTVDGWEPAVAADPEVRALAAGTGDALYVGGLFSTVGSGAGNDHQGIVVFDTSTAPPLPIIPGAPDISGTGVNALLYDTGKLYVGGNFIAAGGARCIDFCVVAFTPPP